MKKTMICIVCCGLVWAGGSIAQEAGKPTEAKPTAANSDPSAVSAPAMGANPVIGRQDREEVFAFTQRPEVIRQTSEVGGRRSEVWIITFASKGACDATVGIVDKDGKILRHLASGVLGAKSPPPFARGTTTQQIVWDGKDDNGQPVALTNSSGKSAGVSAKVGLGLTPVLEKQLEIEPPSVFSRGVAGLAVHNDGSLWFLQGKAWERSVEYPELAVFARDGKYLRTIVPARVDLKPDKRPQNLSGIRSIGRRNMIISDGYLVTISGSEAYVAGRKDNKGQRLIRLGLDGSADDKYAGPVFPEGLSATRAYMALSPDGKTAYVSGLWNDKQKKDAEIILKASLNADAFDQCQGEMCVTGNDNAHFNNPRSLAVDPSGRLLVCDLMNDRISVFTAEGKFQKSLQVKGPELVVINPKTSELYILSIRDRGEKLDFQAQSKWGSQWEPFKDKSVIKFKSVDDFEEVAKIDLPARPLHMHDTGPIMALDSGITPPILYITCVGRQDPGDYLWKIEDRGGTLARADVSVKRYYSPFGPSPGVLATDPVTGDLYLGGRFSPTLYRLSSGSDDLTKLDVAAKYIYDDQTVPLKARQIAGMALDRKGRLYLRMMGTWGGPSNWVVRINRDQSPAPFAKAGKELAIHQPSYGYHNSTIGIATNGDLYVVDAANVGQRGSPGEHNVMNVFNEDGEIKQRDVMPFLTSAVWGPRFDSRNGMYLTDAIRPRKHTAEATGSLLRFSEPKGLLVFDETKPNPDAVYEMRRRANQLIPVSFGGLDWIQYGVGPVPILGYCACRSAPFDVDPFDRVVVSDANMNRGQALDASGNVITFMSNMNRAQVLDSAGNVITFIGEYGNRDSQRPSANLPAPEIPIQGLSSLACGDDVVYLWDSPVSRLLKVRFNYAIQATAPFVPASEPAQKSSRVENGGDF